MNTSDKLRYTHFETFPSLVNKWKWRIKTETVYLCPNEDDFKGGCLYNKIYEWILGQYFAFYIRKIKINGN